MEDAINQCRNGKKEADQRAGSAYIKKRTICADGRANQDKSAEGTNQRGEGNEEGIAGTDVMMPASEEVAELVGEENGEQGDSKGKARAKCGGMFVKQGEGANKFVERDSLILGVGDGELGSRNEASAKGEKEQHGCEQERLCRRPAENRRVLLLCKRNGMQIDVDGDRWRRTFSEWGGHEMFSTTKVSRT